MGCGEKDVSRVDSIGCRSLSSEVHGVLLGCVVRCQDTKKAAAQIVFRINSDYNMLLGKSSHEISLQAVVIHHQKLAKRNI